MTSPDDRMTPYVTGQPTPNVTSTPAYPIGPVPPPIWTPPAPPYAGDAPVPPEQPNRFRWNSWRGGLSLLVIIGGAGVLIGGISERVSGTGGSEFTTAQKDCDSNPPAGTTISDGGKTMIVNMQGTEDTSGMTADMTACVLRELHVSAAVSQHIETTRALDGRQSDRWAGYTASWTYHPDDGLDMVIQR